MENELSKDLTAADIKIQYDAQVKKVLGNKIILAWILHYTVEVFSNLPPEEIVPYIEGEPQIGTVPVYPAHEKISGINGESKEPGEGTITYDVRFWAYLPDRSEHAKVIINVEAQKSYYPGYCIETRGVFYCGRMLSAQMGTEFEEPRYDDLKKVYSIWLCMNVPQYIGNAIAAYTFYKKDILPGMPDRPRAYDKLSVVIICLNEKAESENALNSMLNTLLSAALNVSEKKKRLEEGFGISMKRKLQEEVDLMCNLSELVEEKGRSEGIELGRSEGIELGRSREKEHIARKMILRGTYSDQEILFLSGVDEKRLCRLKEEAK